MSAKMRELGKIWATSQSRPRIAPETKDHWDTLIQSWADSDLPLAIRKSGGIRGGIATHSSGRQIVLTDNSPAQWAFSRAFSGFKYTLDNIREFFRRDDIPFAYASKSAEKSRMTFKCTLKNQDNVNKYGWKLCHILDVGLNTRTPPEQLPLEVLVRHFCLLLKPGNHFLVPLEWAGFGELPEIIEEIQSVESLDQQDYLTSAAQAGGVSGES